MMTTIVIILYLLVLVFDFLPVIKNKDNNITAVYSVLYAASFWVLFLYTLGVEFPSISEYIVKLVHFNF